MEYDIKEVKINYEIGRYFVDIRENLYQIIYDSYRGYSLLNVEEGMTESELYESLESFLKYTTVTTIQPLKQTAVAKFELTTE
jgi:hypothetical protein